MSTDCGPPINPGELMLTRAPATSAPCSSLAVPISAGPSAGTFAPGSSWNQVGVVPARATATYTTASLAAPVVTLSGTRLTNAGTLTGGIANAGTTITSGTVAGGLTNIGTVLASAGRIDGAIRNDACPGGPDTCCGCWVNGAWCSRDVHY